ncbi:MAG: indole-3-glycerol phosphate synthase TrpC [Suipraeoptans sp.]
MNILDELSDRSRKRVKKSKIERSLSKVKEEALKCDITSDFPFYENLKKDEMSFICEVKKASPSKGIIAKDFPYLKIADEYEKADAAAISVLTEPEYFLGDDKYLSDIAAEVTTPILRKDFTVDEYQIYEAKLLGASAILLICSILTSEELKKYKVIANKLGMCALVEVHDEKEVKMALEAGADIIGINNRNLKDFTDDLNTTIKLRALVPSDKILISESGIKTADDIKLLRDNKIDGVLIGETLMRMDNKKGALDLLRSKI